LDEWWTYRPSDLLMFSPRIYWRLFESTNRAGWPLLLGGALAGAVAVAVAWRGPPRWQGGAHRLALAVLACAWGVVAWLFLWQRFQPIQGAAVVFALAFLAQALGLLMWAVVGAAAAEAKRVRRLLGAGCLLWAVFGHPWLAALAGRPCWQAELVGLAPDPTALFTLGWLLAQGVPAAWRRMGSLLWVVPVAWCLVSAATLATMGSAQAVVLLLGPVLVLAARGSDADKRPG
jgi:Family of unknown function (DUF6064)